MLNKEQIINLLSIFRNGDLNCSSHFGEDDCFKCKHCDKKNCIEHYLFDLITEGLLFDLNPSEFEDNLNKQLNIIKENMSIFDSSIHLDIFAEDVKHYITNNQAEVMKKLLDLFKDLRWQIKLNYCKKVTIKDTKPINKYKCGTIVKVRPCREECKNKTYIGFLLGDIALTMMQRITSDHTLEIEHAFYNPAIFIPELKDIVYGCESWWQTVEDEKDLEGLITDDMINNTWYVQLLKQMTDKNET